jgi:hypothetical protein
MAVRRDRKIDPLAAGRTFDVSGPQAAPDYGFPSLRDLGEPRGKLFFLGVYLVLGNPVAVRALTVPVFGEAGSCGKAHVSQRMAFATGHPAAISVVSALSDFGHGVGHGFTSTHNRTMPG